MKKIVKIVPIVIALLFIGIAITPSISSQSPVNNENDQVLTFIWNEDAEEEISLQKEITEEQTTNVNAVMNGFLDYAETVLEDKDISLDEWINLAANANELIQTVKEILKDDIPDINTQEFVQNILIGLSGGWNYPNFKAPIFSIGRGMAWIPLYDYESFFGFMFRPMFITHTIGFTAVYHMNLLPPRFEYLDRLGLYRYTTLSFRGLFLNIGDVGIDRISGPILLIGKSFNMFGEDFP
jgi:hypothetical protein